MSTTEEDLTEATWPGKVRREARREGRGSGTSPIYENIAEVDERGSFFKGRVIRVWFSRSIDGPDPEEDLKTLEDYVHEHRKDEIKPIDYAILLAYELPRVNAVEVKVGDSGSLYYPEWP